MKRIYCTILLTATFVVGNAQKITKDSLVKVISNEVCIEMGKSQSKINKGNLNEQLGLMLLPSIMKHMEEIQEVYKIEDINEKSMYEVGKDVGMRMATSCEFFLKLISENLEEFQSMGEKSKSKAKSENTISGNFIKLTTAEISYIEIKTASGKIEKLFWMGYFDGADDLSNKKITVNKKLKIYFEEKEVFKPALNDYINVKVITKLQQL